MSRIRDLETHPDRHVTPQELAEYYRVAESTIYRQVQKGALPAVRVGRAVRIRLEDAQRYGRPPDDSALGG